MPLGWDKDSLRTETTFQLELPSPSWPATNDPFLPFFPVITSHPFVPYTSFLLWVLIGPAFLHCWLCRLSPPFCLLFVHPCFHFVHPCFHFVFVHHCFHFVFVQPCFHFVFVQPCFHLSRCGTAGTFSLFLFPGHTQYKSKMCLKIKLKKSFLVVMIKSNK